MKGREISLEIDNKKFKMIAENSYLTSTQQAQHKLIIDLVTQSLKVTNYIKFAFYRSYQRIGLLSFEKETIITEIGIKSLEAVINYSLLILFQYRYQF